MNRAFLTAAGAALLTFGSSDLWAHGGQYRGPGCSATPPSTSSGAAPVGGSTAGPAMPGAPAGAPSSGGGGGGGNAGGGVGVASVAARGVFVGDDLTRWQYWWEWNKDPYLRLKESVHATSISTGSDEDLMAGGRRGVASDTLRPTQKQVVMEVLPALRTALETNDQRDIVSSCLIAMAKIGKDHPSFRILPLIRRHLRSPDQEIRETAALSLGIARMTDAAPDLIGLMTDSAVGQQLCDRSSVDERTRSFAAYGLGLLGRHASVGVQRTMLTPLIEAVQSEETGRDLHVAAINAIRLIRPDPAEGPASRILRDESVRVLLRYYRGELRPGEQLIRSHVLPAIAQLVGRGGDPEGTYKKIIAAELVDPKHRDASVTQAAAMALGMMCQPEEVEKADAPYSDVLRHAFQKSLDHQTRYLCLMALGSIGGERNQEWLLGQLDHGGKALIKPWAGFALGTLAFERRDEIDADAVRATIGRALLRQFREVKNDETRGSLAVALGLCGYGAAADDLRAMLSDEKHRDELAGYLCIGLAMMSARESINEIRKIVVTSVRRPERLRQAAIALGKLGDKSASELLLGMLVDDNRNLAKLSSVAVALGLIGDRRSIEPLVKLLLDGSEPSLSRAFAAVALGGVADKDDLPWGTDLAVGINYRAAVGTMTDGVSGVLDIL